MHYPLSPSASSRWTKCPGSLELVRKFGVHESSDFAEEGTYRHELVAQMLRGEIIDKNHPLYSAEAIEHASLCYEYAESLRHNSKRCYVEQELRHSRIYDFGGTIDLQVYGKKSIKIADWKFGKGLRVSAEDNPQLKCYLALAIDFIRDKVDSSWELQAAILQPAFSSEPSIATYTVDEILDWENYIDGRALDNELQTGEHCQFCAAKAQCPAQLEDFRSVESLIEENITLEQARDVMLKEKQVNGFIRACKNRLTTEMVTHGRTVDGLKVVSGRRGNRAWVDTDVARQTLIDAGYTLDQISDLKTPSKIEKELKAKELISPLVSQSEGSPVVASESDPRDEYQRTDAHSEFEGFK